MAKKRNITTTVNIIGFAEILMQQTRDRIERVGRRRKVRLTYAADAHSFRAHTSKGKATYLCTRAS